MLNLLDYVIIFFKWLFALRRGNSFIFKNALCSMVVNESMIKKEFFFKFPLECYFMTLGEELNFDLQVLGPTFRVKISFFLFILNDGNNYSNKH